MRRLRYEPAAAQDEENEEPESEWWGAPSYFEKWLAELGEDEDKELEGDPEAAEWLRQEPDRGS